MMVLVNDVVTGLQSMIGLLSFVFMLVFVTFGSPWRNFFTRGLVLLESGIFLVMIYAIERHAVAPGPPIPPGQQAPAIVAWGILALFELLLTGGLWQVLVWRKGGMRGARAAQRSRRTALAGDPADPVTQAVALLDLLDDNEYAQVVSLVRPR
jgi:hypothetical protein